MRRKELMSRALAVSLATVQAGTLVAPSPISSYAAELTDLDMGEASEEEEAAEEEEADSAKESSKAEEASEAEGASEAEAPVEESTETEETSAVEESSEAEEASEAEGTSEAEAPVEESTESEETSAVEEPTEEASTAEEPTESAEASEAEETSEANEPTESAEASETEETSEANEPTEPEETLESSPAADAKIYKITVIDILVDGDGNELGSETRLVDELKEGEEYTYTALDDEGLSVVGEDGYSGICDSDLTVEFRYTSEDLGIDLLANFSNYLNVTDEFYDTDGSLLGSSSRKYRYDSIFIPSVDTLKQSGYTVTAVIVRTYDKEYDVTDGSIETPFGWHQVYDSSNGTIDCNSLSGTGIGVEEIVIRYTENSGLDADTVTLTVVDEFYDQDQATLIERREREVKEVTANQVYSFNALDGDGRGYDYYVLSDEVQSSNAEADGEIVFKYAKYINIGARHIYKDSEGNTLYTDYRNERFKYNQGYTIEPRPSYNGESYEVEGTDIYTGRATSDVTVEFTYRKVDEAILDITYEYYDTEGGTLLGTGSEQKRIKRGNDYVPEDTKYYDNWEYRPVSAGVTDVQDDASVTVVYVKKRKYTVTGVFKYHDKDGTEREDRKPREFYEGSDVVVNWDYTPSTYLLTSGDRNITNLQGDVEVELTFTEGEYTVTYNIKMLAADGTLERTQTDIGYYMAGDSSKVPDCPSGYEWTVEPQVVDNIQQNVEVDCECKEKYREMCTITIIDRFLSADGKRVLFEYTRTEEHDSGSYAHLKKPVKQGFIPRSITSYISEVNSDMTVVNESVASDKDCTVRLFFSYKGKTYEYPSLTVKPGTLINRHDDFPDLQGIVGDGAHDYVSYNVGDELPYNTYGYYYITGDTEISASYSPGYDTYPLLVIDRYYDKAGKVVSEIVRKFGSYQAGDSVTMNALSKLEGYKPREESKTVIVSSDTDEMVFEYDECATYKVAIKDKYYDTDGVTLLDEKVRSVETYNAGDDVTVYSQYEDLYTCDEVSKTITNIQADTEIEFVYVKKSAYTVDITYIYYEPDGVTEIKRETDQQTVFAGDYCFIDVDKLGYYHTLDDTAFIPDKNTQIEVALYKYSTLKVIFHVLDSKGNEIDVVRSELSGLQNGLQTIYVDSPKYTSPSVCEKEVEVADGMEVSFNVTAVPTQVTVTDCFGTIASYYLGADYMSGQEVPYIISMGIEDTADKDTLVYGDYCFISTEAATTRTVEMNYGDSEDKLLGSHKGWRLVPQYKTSDGDSLAIRVAEPTYMSASGYTFGYNYDYASESPSGNKCYFIKSSSTSVTVTADGKTYTADGDGKIVTPDDPADKEGYIFGGWSCTEGDDHPGNRLDFTTEVFDTDTEVYPIWIKSYKVMADGKDYMTDKVGKIITPDAPAAKEGYDFKGWSRTDGDTDESNKLDFSTEVFTEDTTVYPIWVRTAVIVTAEGKTYTADEDGHIRTPDMPASRTGYWFKGWSRTENDTNPDNRLDFTSEVFDTDTEIYPIWVKKPVVTADGKTYLVDEDGHIQTPDAPADKAGYIFDGWSRTPDDTDSSNRLNFASEVFDTDTEVYPIWIKSYKVTAGSNFYMTDKSGKIQTPENPAKKDGYSFKGWSRTDGDTDKRNKLDFSSEVFVSDTEVYPIWVALPVVTADGKTYTADEDGHIPTPDAPADKDGYIFVGWSRTPDDIDTDNKLDFTDEVFDDDTEIYPIWVKEVVVTADGKTYTADENGKIVTPDNPAHKEGYIFAGWSRTADDTDRSHKLDFSIEVFDTDTEVYPIWVREYTVTADGKDYKTDIDGHIQTPDAPLDKEGYIFKGWSRTPDDTDPDNKLDFTSEVFDGDMEVYPIWVKRVVVTADGKSYVVDDDGKIQTPDVPLNKEGYIFGGWSRTEGDTDKANKLDLSSEVFTSDTEIYPIWMKEVTVTADGKAYKADIDGHIQTPDAPADKEGYIFGGWSRDEDETDLDNKLDFTIEVFDTDTEVYPIWVQEFTVTADGKDYKTDIDGHIHTPDVPADKEGYSFKGWSRMPDDTNPDNRLDFGSEVFTSDTEIYPIWVKDTTGSDNQGISQGSGNSSGGSSSGSSRRSSGSSSSYQELSGSWVYLEDGRWRYKLTDGSEIIGKWAYLKNPYAVTSLGQNEVDWFRFDDEGYMVTGWYTDVDGNIYYLHPISDGSQGHMYTGWHWIEGTDGLLRCYYFNTESNGTRGALYRSKATPDGSIVDESGAWVVGDGAVTREAVKTVEEELTIAKDSTTRSILRSINRIFNLA